MPLIRALGRGEVLALAIWGIELLRLTWETPWLTHAGTTIMAAYIVLVAPQMRRQTLILTACLAVAATGVAVWCGLWRTVPESVARASVFPAFFGALMLLRATADLRHETTRARTLFGALSEGQRRTGFLVGAQFMGGLLVVGVMAILASVLSRDASDADRRDAAEAALRGMCLSCLWSPFWVAMAVAYQHLPGVALWRLMAIGIPLAAVGLVVSHLIYARDIGVARLWQVVRALAPILPPVIIFAALVALMTGTTDLSTLQAVMVVTPVVCFLALVWRGRGAIAQASSATYRDLGGIADETVLVTVALVLGRVLEAALVQMGIAGAIAEWELPAAAVIGLTVGLITLAAMAGVHQIVTATVMLVLFAPMAASGGIAPVVLMESMLIGWAFSSMVGLSAVTIAVTGSMFRVPRERLCFGANLWFVLVFGGLAVTTLAVLDGVG